MEISFHGAAKTVTGSKYLVELQNGKRILLDCGMFQGLGHVPHEMNHHFGSEPLSIDCVILTHAHPNHSGLIPRLVKEGFTGKIYTSKATYDLCKIMLADSTHIQEADA